MKPKLPLKTKYKHSKMSSEPSVDTQVTVVMIHAKLLSKIKSLSKLKLFTRLVKPTLIALTALMPMTSQKPNLLPVVQTTSAEMPPKEKKWTLKLPKIKLLRKHPLPLLPSEPSKLVPT